jgi:rubrerythrin
MKPSGKEECSYCGKNGEGLDKEDFCPLCGRPSEGYRITIQQEQEEQGLLGYDFY